jgi:hypothetical protein
MSTPDQRLLEADLVDAEFRAGCVKGLWGIAENSDAPTANWPFVKFWLAAAARPGAPERYVVRTDLTGYRTVAPTGTFWDCASNGRLDFSKFPNGKTGSRFAMVFRTDWGESGRAFYHPYDRVAAHGHNDWQQTQPHLVWSANHTIIDYLEEFQTLLNSEDYLGLRS